MKTWALLCLFTLHSHLFGADDIRSKVAQRKDEPALTKRIDPDASIYGIPFGTTEDEFMTKHDKPTGYVRLGGGESAMIYGRSHAFLFEAAKLIGVRITGNIIDWKLSNTSPPSPFDAIAWRLSNGIEREMSLAEVKKILGDKLAKKQYEQYYYVTEKAQVDLDFSHYTNEGDGDEAYKLFGILVKQGEADPDIARRGPMEEFGGVGILMTQKKGAEFPVVQEVVRDGAADKAGVRRGMVILAVDGTPLSGKTLQESVALLRGKPDSRVTLELLDPAADKTNKITISRTRIVVHGKP